MDYRFDFYILLYVTSVVFLAFIVSEYTEYSGMETIKIWFYKIYLKFKYIKFKRLFNKTVKIIRISKKNNILSIDFLNDTYKELEKAWHHINSGYSFIFIRDNVNEAIINIRKGTVLYTLVTEKLANALIKASEKG